MKPLIIFSFIFFALILTHNETHAQTVSCHQGDSLFIINDNGGPLCEGGVAKLKAPVSPDLQCTWQWLRGGIWRKMSNTNGWNILSHQAYYLSPATLGINGSYRCIVIDTSVTPNCVDTIYGLISVLYNPIISITETQQCNGIKLVAKNLKKASSTDQYFWMDGSGSYTIPGKTYIYSGSPGMGSNRSVKVTNQFGCSAKYTSNQLSPQKLESTILGNKKIVLGGSTNLTVSTNYPINEYKWFFRGILNPSFTSDTYIASDTGNVRSWVKTSTIPSCTLNKTVKITYSSTLRIEDETTYDGQLNAYPIHFRFKKNSNCSRRDERISIDQTYFVIIIH